MRREFLGRILAIAAALTVGRLWRGKASGNPADTPATAQPRGWREARHWRKV